MDAPKAPPETPKIELSDRDQNMVKIRDVMNSVYNELDFLKEENKYLRTTLDKKQSLDTDLDRLKKQRLALSLVWCEAFGDGMFPALKDLFVTRLGL